MNKRNFDYNIAIPKVLKTTRLEMASVKLEKKGETIGGYISPNSFSNFGGISKIELLFKSESQTHSYIVTGFSPHLNLDFIYRYYNDILSIQVNEKDTSVSFVNECQLNFPPNFYLKNLYSIKLSDTYKYSLSTEEINLKINVEIGLVFELTNMFSFIVFMHDFSHLNFCCFEQNQCEDILEKMFEDFYGKITLHQLLNKEN